MKFPLLLIALLYAGANLHAQEKKLSNTRFVLGLSGPELLHAGITYRLANVSQLGASFGAGPSLGTIWTSLNLEHRLYFGNTSGRSGWKTWFCRQGLTFFPSAKTSQQLAWSLTVGKDLPFKNGRNGFTIDAGIFHLKDSERSSLILVKSANLWPALRFQFYFSL